jgi:hypothetical protein
MGLKSCIICQSRKTDAIKYDIINNATRTNDIGDLTRDGQRTWETSIAGRMYSTRECDKCATGAECIIINFYYTVPESKSKIRKIVVQHVVRHACTK